ncbi:MAG: hypothetical protein JO102_04310, partial [Elusimicrobia bacterium]|nr:hypothetical protein [Elusimicrobiota bacterium]
MLNFDAIERERALVIQKLAATLPEAELKVLLARSIDQRSGAMSYGEYTRYFVRLCESARIDLRKTPALRRYVDYVLLCDGIDASALFAATERMEASAESLRSPTADQQALLDAAKQLRRLRKLALFEMTPHEWELYRTDRRGLKDLSDVLTRLGVPPESGDAFPSLWDAALFYREAEARSRTMVKTVAERLKAGPVVLVAGGFHAADLEAAFRSQGIPFASVSPRLSKIDSDGQTSYLSVFGREKTPLERLLKGEKLFINPTLVNVQDPELDLETRGALRLARGDREVAVGKVGDRPVFAGFRVTWKDREVARVPLPDGKTGKLYVAAAAGLKGLALLLIAPIVETRAFQQGGLALAAEHLARFGLSQPAAIAISVAGVGLAFAFAHFIVRWVVRAYQNGWRAGFTRAAVTEDLKTLAFDVGASALLSLPFLVLSPVNAFWVAAAAHAVINGIWWLLHSRVWFPKFWKPQSIFNRVEIVDTPPDAEPNGDREFLTERVAQAMSHEFDAQSSEEVVQMLNRVTKAEYTVEDFNGEVKVGWFADGEHKHVFRAEFERNQSQGPARPLQVIIAVKQEKEAGDIQPTEMEDLELLSGETPHTPVFGGRFEAPDGQGDPLEFYVEEFIDGPTARQLMQSGNFTDEDRALVVWALLRISRELEQMPKDAHGKNFILRNELGGRNAIMVDIGHRRTEIDRSLLRVISFYGHSSENPGSNRFVFETYVDVFRDRPVDGYEILQRNLIHIRQQQAADRRRGVK